MFKNLQPAARTGVLVSAFLLYYFIVLSLRKDTLASFYSLFITLLIAPILFLPIIWFYKNIQNEVVKYIQTQLDKGESIIYKQMIYYKLTYPNGKIISNIIPLSLGFSSKADLFSATDEDTAYLVLTSKDRLIIGSRVRKSESPNQKFKIITEINKSDIRKMTIKEADSQTPILKRSPGLKLEIYTNDRNPWILEMATGGYNGMLLGVNKISVDFKKRLELFFKDKVDSGS